MKVNSQSVSPSSDLDSVILFHCPNTDCPLQRRKYLATILTLPIWLEFKMQISETSKSQPTNSPTGYCLLGIDYYVRATSYVDDQSSNCFIYIGIGIISSLLVSLCWWENPLQATNRMQVQAS